MRVYMYVCMYIYIYIYIYTEKICICMCMRSCVCWFALLAGRDGRVVLLHRNPPHPTINLPALLHLGFETLNPKP